MWTALRRQLGDGAVTVESIGIGSVSERHSRAGLDPEVLQDRSFLGDGDALVSVIIQPGASFGLPGAIERILMCRRPEGCVLLRFHGHGSAGSMVVAGDNVPGSQFYPYESAGYRAELERLRSFMGRFGSIELHGCHVGQGELGLRSLTILAEAANVPVTAAYHSQYGGVSSDRFEGPVRTVFPQPTTLRDWAAEQMGYASHGR